MSRGPSFRPFAPDPDLTSVGGQQLPLTCLFPDQEHHSIRKMARQCSRDLISGLTPLPTDMTDPHRKRKRKRIKRRKPSTTDRHTCLRYLRLPGSSASIIIIISQKQTALAVAWCNAQYASKSGQSSHFLEGRIDLFQFNGWSVCSKTIFLGFLLYNSFPRHPYIFLKNPQ